MVDTPETLEDDAFIRAGEYALGVLEGEELASARGAMLSDRTFADAVEWWEYRLGAMNEAGLAIVPSPSVWSGIAARIDSIDVSRDETLVPISVNRPSPWSLTALVAGASMAAAGLVLFINAPRDGPVSEGPPIAAAVGPKLIAQIQDDASGRKLVGIVDVDTNRLALNVSGLEAEAGKTPELWVIPAGGAPVSLGAIPETGSFDRELSLEEAGFLVSGSTLAVTFEENTGLRHETPTMPILLAGALDQV